MTITWLPMRTAGYGCVDGKIVNKKWVRGENENEKQCMEKMAL